MLLAVSCGQKKKTAANKKIVSERFAGLIPERPKPARLVSDFADIYSSRDESKLEEIAVRHDDSTSNQIAIITLNLDTTRVRTYEGFDSLSLELVRHWGIGVKGKNNGVGIIIAPNLRMTRIQVGYGLEEKLTDQECQKILDDIMIPLFKKGEYFIGTGKSLEGVISEIK